VKKATQSRKLYQPGREVRGHTPGEDQESSPLSEEEHIFLCAFVSVMLQRTLRNRDNLERFIDELIGRAEALERSAKFRPTNRTD